MATLTINTDEKTAENFYAFCEELGLDMSTAINLFIRTCLREKRIPFELSLLKNTPPSIEELMENLDV
ncbi:MULTISPECIES: type II toxin-antitoxin system RelB/DinJ family antitoxin [Fusobacterium]|uniref:type II toxin-antitoxin system RelB/DinJ family antitoxin n=1 Tax=Fusobacterium TaxID=848 RepID=UPI00044A92D4|nr:MULTISPECIES: type II toxin-antitoxin system RelB/DinJ family antitoxin [unclassified Fusobacterium]EUB33575.1 addiction module antitoxin, RelB/DinJ family [Fusobacterium sp. CM1]